MASYDLACVYGLILNGKCAILSYLDSNGGEKRGKMPLDVLNTASYGQTDKYGLKFDGECAMLSDFGSNGG